jgi:cyanate lyase
MDKRQMTKTIIANKLARGLSWEVIAETLGKSGVWLTSACLGMNSAPPE